MSSLVVDKPTKTKRDAKYGSQAGPLNQRKGDESITDYTSISGRKYLALDPKSGTKLNEGNLKLLRLAADKHKLHYITEGGWHKSKEYPVKWINAIEDIFETEVIKNNGKPYKFTAGTSILIPSHVRWIYENPPPNQGKSMSFTPLRMIKIKRAPNQPPLKTMTEGKKKKAEAMAKKESDAKKPPAPYNKEQRKAAVKRYLEKRKRRFAKYGTVGTGLKTLSISTPKNETVTPKVHTPPAQAFLEQQKRKEKLEQDRIDDRNTSWNYQNRVIQEKFKKKFKDIQAIKKECSKDSIFKHIHKISNRIDQHIHHTNIELDKSYTYKQSNFSGQWNERGISSYKTVIDKDGNKKRAKSTPEDISRQKEQINTIKKKIGDLEKIKNRLGVLRDEVRLKFKSKRIDIQKETKYPSDLKKNYKDVGIDYLLKPSDIQPDLIYDEDDTQQYSAIMQDIFQAIAKPSRINDIEVDKDYFEGGLEEVFGFELDRLDGIDAPYGFEESEKETVEKLANSRGLIKLRKDKMALKTLFDKSPEMINNYVANVIAHEMKNQGRLIGMQNKAPQLPKPWSIHTSKSQGKQYLWNKVTNERLWVVDPRNPCVGFKWGGQGGKEKIMVNICQGSSSGGRIIAIKGINNDKPFEMSYQKNPNIWIDLIAEGYGIDPACPWLDVFYIDTEKKGNNKASLYIHKPWLHWITYHVYYNRDQRKHLSLLKANKFKQIITFEIGNIYIFDEYAQPANMINHIQSGLLLDETTSYLMRDKNGGVQDTKQYISEPGPLYYHLKYVKEDGASSSIPAIFQKQMNMMDNLSSLTDSSKYSNSDDYMFQNFHVVKTHPQQWDIIETKYKQAGVNYLKKDIKKLKNQINTGVYGRPKIIQKRMYQGKEITEYPSYNYDSRETDHYETIIELLKKMEELYSTMGSGSDDSIENLNFDGGRKKHKTRRRRKRKKKTKRKRGGKRNTKKKKRKRKTRKK